MGERRVFGLSAALITPFAADGTVDLPRLVRHAERVLAGGCDSVTLFGTTGEGFSIGSAERAAMLGALAGAGLDPAARLYAGVMATGVAEAAEQARLALSFGARGLLFTPPFYLKDVDDEGLYAWFSRSFEAVGADLRAVILYHIPGQTAVPLSTGLVGRLRRAFPEAVRGVKDSSGDWAGMQAFLAEHGDLAILIGDERLLVRGMAAGAQGSICGLANVAPELLRPVVHERRDDPLVAAATDAVLGVPVLPALKALVAHRYRDPAYARTRPPLVALDPGRAAELAARFDAALAGAEAA